MNNILCMHILNVRTIATETDTIHQHFKPTNKCHDPHLDQLCIMNKTFSEDGLIGLRYKGCG